MRADGDGRLQKSAWQATIFLLIGCESFFVHLRGLYACTAGAAVSGVRCVCKRGFRGVSYDGGRSWRHAGERLEDRRLLAFLYLFVLQHQFDGSSHCVGRH